MSSIKQHIITLLLCLVSLCAQAQLNTDRITSIGRNALYFDDYVLSIQYFNQVIKLKPHLAEPYLLRAIAKIQLSDYMGALRDCNMSIENNPFQPGAYYTRGYIYRQLEDWDKAEADFTQALHFSPENKTYFILRADVRAQKHEYDLAMEDIEYLLRKEPKSASLHFEKGVICMGNNDTLCALNAFQQTVRYDSQNATNWSALGMVQLMQENDDEALVSLSKAIQLGSKWAGDYINRGIIHYNKHDYRKALADYDKAVSIAPQDAQSYYNRGMLRTELGDNNRAVEDFDKAIELAPEKVELRFQRAMVLLHLRQWKEALADLDVMIAHYPYFLPSYYYAAQAKTAMGDSKKAYQYRKTAFDLEQKKDSIVANDSISAPNTGVQVAYSSMQSKDRRKEFSARIAQSQNEEEEPEYESATRGRIQNRPVNVINIPNINDSIYEELTNLTDTVGVDFDAMLARYDSLAAAEPSVAFHPYNKANVLCILQRYAEALQEYDRAIAIDSEFAEAYFNRGLTRIYTDDVDRGIADLSQAGELGIYQAYNLITRFQ